MRASAIRSLKLSLLSFLLGSAMALGATALDEIRPRAGDAPASGCATQCGGDAASDIPPCIGCNDADAWWENFTKIALPCGIFNGRGEHWIRVHITEYCANGYYKTCEDIPIWGCTDWRDPHPCDYSRTCFP
jgi:hypothetical protein